MAILATEKVLTLDYWKLASDVRTGDIVFDRTGKPVKVKLAQQYRAKNCYEVQFHDHLTVAGDTHLKLPLETPKYRARVRQYKGVRKFRRPLRPTPISELVNAPLTHRNNRMMYSVPTTGAIQFPHQTLPVPPFIFGFWFFNRKKDGTLKPPVIFDEFVREKFKSHGYIPSKKAAFTTTPTVVSHLIPSVPTKIPNNYLFSDPEQRQELLSGILHSKAKQFNKKNQIFRFTWKTKHSVTQVQNLAESLGCKTKMLYDRTKKYYTLFIKTKLQLTQEQTPEPIKVRQTWRLVREIYEIEPQNCVHIETDGEDNTILVGEGFIPCL